MYPIGMLPDQLHLRRNYRILVPAFLMLLASACAGGEALDDTDSDDAPPGRGILTGQSGEFVIYRK